MVLTDVRLQNYRSYKDVSFDLSEGVVIIVGPNAAGKTNLLEAVLMVTSGQAYRGKNDLIRHEESWARVDVHTSKNLTRTTKLRLDESTGKTNFEFVINEKSYKRLPYSQKEPAVLFEPNNLLLLHGERQARREYLDNLSSNLISGFDSALSRYKRILAQRNSLLKSPRLDHEQLFVWNIRLTETAELIVKQRLKILRQIEQKLGETYSKISGAKSELKLSYKSILNTDSYSASLLKKLENEIELDRARGFTGSGPHREDFVAILNNEPVETTASRGETRTLLLALKIIELELLEEASQTRPILLLDDVFSELDGARRKALTKFLKKYQTLITTTDADIILKNFSQNCQIIPL